MNRIEKKNVQYILDASKNRLHLVSVNIEPTVLLLTRLRYIFSSRYHGRWWDYLVSVRTEVIHESQNINMPGPRFSPS